jgi:hypothetical protein
MQVHWIVFLSDTNITRLVMLQNLLEEHNIPVQILNKTDSVYPTLGESELYIDESRLTEAMELMKSNSENSASDFTDN